MEEQSPFRSYQKDALREAMDKSTSSSAQALKQRKAQRDLASDGISSSQNAEDSGDARSTPSKANAGAAPRRGQATDTLTTPSRKHQISTAGAMVGRQHRFKAPPKARPSTYDITASPEKVLAPPKRSTNDQFSPRRNEKKRKQPRLVDADVPAPVLDATHSRQRAPKKPSNDLEGRGVASANIRRSSKKSRRQSDASHETECEEDVGSVMAEERESPSNQFTFDVDSRVLFVGQGDSDEHDKAPAAADEDLQQAEDRSHAAPESPRRRPGRPRRDERRSAKKSKPRAQPKTAPKLASVQLRPSTLYSRDQADTIQEGPLEVEKQDAAPRMQVKKRKRASLLEDKAPRAVKRVGRDLSPAQELPSGDDQDEVSSQSDNNVGSGPHRLLSHSHLLRGVYSAVKQIGVRHRGGEMYTRSDIDLTDEDVSYCDSAEVFEHCTNLSLQVKRLKARIERAMLALERLQTDDNRETLPDPPREFTSIRRHVRRLCGMGEEKPDFHDQEKITNIYFHLFPLLIKLLRRTIKCYESIDANAPPEGRLPMSMMHLKTVVMLMSLIQEMGHGAKEYSKPEPSLAVVRPVRNGLLAPLRQISEELTILLSKHESAHRQERLRVLHAAESERRQREAKDEETRRKSVEKLRKEWRSLHRERKDIALQWSLRLSGTKREEWLRFVGLPPEQLDTDANGKPYKRIGPSIADMEKARAERWEDYELEALIHGLKNFQNDIVISRIIYEYCRPEGPLHQRNVTDIVTKAADLKQSWEELAAQKEKPLCEWARNIPVWTRTGDQGNRDPYAQQYE